MMRFIQRALRISMCLLVFCCLGTLAQNQPQRAPVVVTVVDENNTAVPGAELTIQEPGKVPVRLTTDFNGRASYIPQGNAPYTLHAQKAGFYAATANENDPTTRDVRVVLNHEQMLVQQVSVTAS